jgi:DNA-binding response OmpR family regulator
MMPDMDGFECARRLAATANVPIIFLSARNEPSFKLRAFELGADDYITKPFLVDELIARIRAVMRRSQYTPEQSARQEYENGPMHLSEANRSLRINGHEVKLTKSEYLLLLALMKHPGSVISHEQLLRSVRNDQSSGDVQNLRVAFSRIRRKLEENGLQGGVISAYSGVGYMLRDLVRDPLL